MIRLIVSLASLAAAAGLLQAQPAPKPEHSIIFIIDGLSHKALDRLPLPNLRALASRGAYFRKSYTLLPAHPVSGGWAKYHESSIPNPIIYAGTYLLRPDQRWIQESFFRSGITANVVNDGAYVKLNTGYHLTFQLGHVKGKRVPDSVALDHAIGFLRAWKPTFMRIHLQEPGSAGWDCYSTPDASLPWRRNIWAEGSPYVRTVLEADRLLGVFMDELAKLGLVDSTLLFVTADHGESDRGWHIFEDEDGWAMPLIIAGPGVKRGVVFDYAEQIDIVPTLSYLTRVKGPANADGIILAEALEHPPAQAAARKLKIAQFNRQLLAGNALIAHVRERVKSEYHLQGALRAAEEAFQDVDRILEWHQFGSLERLFAANQEVIDRLKKATMP